MHWKNLKVWQEAHNLTLVIYKITTCFPSDEKYVLVSQLRRSAISISANIVEGQARNTTKEYINFLYNARGSLEETRYHLLLARDLKYLEHKQYAHLEQQCENISKMLNGLIKSLKQKQLNP